MLMRSTTTHTGLWLCSIVVAPSLAILFYAAWAHPWPFFHYSKLTPTLPQPSIVISQQPEAPLRLSVLSDQELSDHSPKVEVKITNVSQKAISAYVIAYEILTDKWERGGAELSVAGAVSALFKPRQSTSKVLGAGIHQSIPMQQVKILVDFVEFADGITWGGDLYRNWEYLNGMRKGGRDAQRALSRLFDADQQEAFIKAVKGPSINLLPPGGHSERWSEGYRVGVESTKERVKRAAESGVLSELETALRQPFDAIDEMRRR